MQSVCERQLIRLETFSFSGEEGWPGRGGCHHCVLWSFHLPTVLWSISEFYDREVTNTLNLRQSQEHGLVVMAGDEI